MFNEEKHKNKIVKQTVDYLGILLVIVISIVYLFKGFFEPGWSNIPIWVRIMDGIISIAVATSIQSSMGLQAIINGMKLESNRNLNEEHTEAIKEANDYIEYSDEYFNIINKEAYRTERIKEMSKVGLKYSDYFDEDGDYTGKLINNPKSKRFSPEQKQYRKRVKGLNKALKVKITHLTFDAISATDNDSGDANDLGMTPMRHQARRVNKKLASKIVYVSILSQITWSLIMGRNALEQLFNGAIQIALYLIIGGIDYYVNWIFMTDSHPHFMKKKINHAKGLTAFGKKRGEEYGERRQGQNLWDFE